MVKKAKDIKNRVREAGKRGQEGGGQEAGRQGFRRQGNRDSGGRETGGQEAGIEFVAGKKDVADKGAWKRLQTTTNVYIRLQVLKYRLVPGKAITIAKNQKVMTQNKGYRSLIAYQKSFNLAMAIFRLTKKFPAEERYELTSQIRRSSRSVCANLVEGYRKSMYPKLFMNKLVISDGECSETLLWLEFAVACEYISTEEFTKYELLIEEVGKLLGAMIKTPERFGAMRGRVAK